MYAAPEPKEQLFDVFLAEDPDPHRVRIDGDATVEHIVGLYDMIDMTVQFIQPVNEQ